MRQIVSWRPGAQILVVLLCALALKLYYSTASPNELRWILAPTTFLVEVVAGRTFTFESYAGYVSGDRKFVIAASCAGINFMITAFLMLSLGKLRRDRSRKVAWTLIPIAALCAYFVTIIANTIRISTALRLHQMPVEFGWLNPNQLHRLEGIVIYFGFLLLLFVVSEKMSSGRVLDLTPEENISPRNPVRFRRWTFPLVVYYATTLGIPLANGAYRQGVDFWEHSLFVLLTPLLLILPVALFIQINAARVLGGKGPKRGEATTPRQFDSHWWRVKAD
jgi:exosortase K